MRMDVLYRLDLPRCFSSHIVAFDLCTFVLLAFTLFTFAWITKKNSGK
jgi:hypothetical protein